MKSLCGADCIKCHLAEQCKGCVDTNGCPFGKECLVAKRIKLGGMEKYEESKKALISAFNRLDVPDMPEIKELYPLCGSFVNLEYELPSGQRVKFLDDDSIYLGNQVEHKSGRCFGMVAGEDFLLVCRYVKNGTDPEILIYVHRNEDV